MPVQFTARAQHQELNTTYPPMTQTQGHCPHSFLPLSDGFPSSLGILSCFGAQAVGRHYSGSSLFATVAVPAGPPR